MYLWLDYKRNIMVFVKARPSGGFGLSSALDLETCGRI